MKKNKPTRIDDASSGAPFTDIVDTISRRLYGKLAEGKKRGEVIGHNLEYGLGAEIVFRNLLREILPKKYGVGKGKLINKTGGVSRHLDVIIYDQINCPSLFADEHENLILPIEGALVVIEIKTRTTSSVLREAFENLKSVSDLMQERLVCSSNNLVDYCPPELCIFSFSDDRKLETVIENYIKLSNEFSRNYSFSSYSKKSPGYKVNNGKKYLVSSISILGKGEVCHMLDGSTSIGKFGEHTFGMLVSTILMELSDIQLPKFNFTNYIHWLGAGVREIYS